MQIEARNISFRYGEKMPWILKNVSMSVEEKERVGLLGPSGRGKSTLIKLIAGYLKPVEGEILLDGKPLPSKGISPVQLIYQHPEKAINPRWKMKKVLQESGMYREEVMETLGIEKDWLERYPRELSGGELQRVLLSMAVMDEPNLLLLDEPVSGIDQNGMDLFYETVDNLKKHYDLAIILISHDLDYVAKYADQVVLLDGGTVAKQGTVRQVYESDVFKKVFGTFDIAEQRTTQSQIIKEQTVQEKGQSEKEPHPIFGKKAILDKKERLNETDQVSDSERKGGK